MAILRASLDFAYRKGVVNMEKIINYWNSLPKWVKIIPYILASGAIAELIKHLELVQVENPYFLGGLINIAIVALKGLLVKLMELRK